MKLYNEELCNLCAPNSFWGEQLKEDAATRVYRTRDGDAKLVRKLEGNILFKIARSVDNIKADLNIIMCGGLNCRRIGTL
jgi:hypothetical protein